MSKLVLAGTVCASTPSTRRPPSTSRPCGTATSEETNAPLRRGQEGTARRRAQAYREQYGLDATYLLPANLYGPRDNFDLETSHVVPALIRKMLAGEPEVVLWGDGSPTREFLYVEDAAEAFVLAAAAATGPEPINVGTGAEIAICELAETIADLTGFTGEIVWGPLTRCRTASRVDDSTSPGRASCSASRRPRPCARGCTGRSSGTAPRRAEPRYSRCSTRASSNARRWARMVFWSESRESTVE